MDTQARPMTANEMADELKVNAGLIANAVGTTASRDLTAKGWTDTMSIVIRTALIVDRLNAVLGKRRATHEAARAPVERQRVHTRHLPPELRKTDVQGRPWPKEAVVPLKGSLKPHSITCLLDGESFKMMRRHLMEGYGLTPDQYRRMFDLPDEYPMVADSYRTEKREKALEQRLGHVTATAAHEKPRGADGRYVPEKVHRTWRRQAESV